MTSAPSDPQALADAAATELLERTGVDSFDVAVVLGSGVGAAAAELGEPTAVVPWRTFPDSPRPPQRATADR